MCWACKYWVYGYWLVGIGCVGEWVLGMDVNQPWICTGAPFIYTQLQVSVFENNTSFIKMEENMTDMKFNYVRLLVEIISSTSITWDC